MRNNSGVIGNKQTPSISSASGIFNLVDQQVLKSSGSWPISGADFTISPSVDGFSSWTLDSSGNGDLNLSANNEYTISVLTSFTAVVQMWGAGGARGYNYTANTLSITNQGNGGGGGHSNAVVNFVAGETFKFRVGQGGARSTVSSSGATYLAGGVGFTGDKGGTQGGGYTGIFKDTVTQANTYLLAGGGGGGSDSTLGISGAGGGANGANSTAGSGQGGNGGTQTAGGAASQYNGATAGSALLGGVAESQSTTNASLGGGGGGYYGGGGGNVGGGGGGSGYVNPNTSILIGRTLAGSGNVAAVSASANGAGEGGSASQGNRGADGRIFMERVKTASLSFDGTGDYITANAGSSLTLSEDFTIELYVRFASLASYSTPFTLASSSSGGENYIQSDTSGGTSFSWVGWGATISAGTNFQTNTWYHLALCRSGTTLRSFRDGVLVATGSSSSTIPTTGGFVYVGSQNSTQWFFNGYISNLRIVKGTALYTADFVRPQTNLTAVSNTSLLLASNQLAGLDWSTNKHGLAFNGNATYTTSIVPF